MKNLEQLVTEVVAGDKGAFEELYLRTYKQVHFTCMAFLKNEQDAADVSQEVYITVLKSISEVKDRSKFEHWLGRVTANKCKDFVKKNRPIPVDDETLEELALSEEELLLPEDYVIDEAKRKILTDIMKESLSDVLYQTVVLFYFQNMSAAEIAEVMECPVGTVTSRLCLARAKIKQEVLKYEEKSGDKLHSVVLLPILASVLTANAMGMSPKNQCANVLEASGSTTTSVAVATANTGGKLMLRTWKAKIIVALLVLAVVVGGIVAIVTLTGEDEGRDRDVRQEEESKNEENIPTKVPEGEGENGGQAGITATPTPEVGGDVTVDAAVRVDAARDKVDRYLTALKTGDVETLLTLVDPESDSYEVLEEIRDYEYADDFIRAFYKNICWTHTEENLARWEQTLTADLDEDLETVWLEMEYGLPCHLLFKEMYCAAYEDGTVIPEYLDYRVTADNEEALQLLQRTTEALPLVNGINIHISVPDENGDFYFKLDDIFEKFELDELDTDPPFVAFYMNDVFKLTTDVLAGPSTAPYYQYNDEWLVLKELLLAKDYYGIGNWLADYTGENELAEKEESKGTYEELTDSQKAWVDKFLSENVVCFYTDHTKLDYAGEDVRDGAFVMLYPDINHYYVERSQWRIDNNVVFPLIVWPFSMKPESFDTFVSYYFFVIEYAANVIE